MSWRETAALIICARREGVTLTAKADGRLGLKADRPPPAELLTILKEHKADIRALLPPPPGASPALGRARRTVSRLRDYGFRAYLDSQGALLITDTTGKKRRNVLDLLPRVFDELVAGLDEDPGLFDLSNEGETK